MRVLTERLDHVDSVSLGLWLDSGVTDDPEDSNGMTHLIEHMVFKGTRTRSNRRIAETIDDIGGNVNGLTDREFTYLYARTTSDHVEQALELLLDMLLESECRARDLEKEKEVVLQEIRLVEDTPEDWVHDALLEVVWPEHPLGRPVLGKAESISQMAGRLSSTIFAASAWEGISWWRRRVGWSTRAGSLRRATHRRGPRRGALPSARRTGLQAGPRCW